MTTEQLTKVIIDAVNAHGFRLNDNPPTLEASKPGPPGLIRVTDGHSSWHVHVEQMRS